MECYQELTSFDLVKEDKVFLQVYYNFSSSRLAGLPRDPAGHQEDPRQGPGTRGASSHQTRASHVVAGGQRRGGGGRRRRRVCPRTHGDLLENAYKKQHAPTQGHTQRQAESPAQAEVLDQNAQDTHLGAVTGRRLGSGIGRAHSQHVQEQDNADLEQRQVASGRTLQRADAAHHQETALSL